MLLSGATGQLPWPVSKADLANKKTSDGVKNSRMAKLKLKSEGLESYVEQLLAPFPKRRLGSQVE